MSKTSTDKISADRCKQFRRRILEVSQTVPALHIGGAFSSVEILEAIYFHLKKPEDVFILSKGHAGILQYVVLEELGLLDLSEYGKTLDVHPTLGTPGVEASTGSLGHGLGIGVGMAYTGVKVFCVISDGECQEGSTWEAVMMAANLKLSNLICFLDNNDLQSASRSSVNHPALYPLAEKFRAFGWDALEVDGHDSEALCKVRSLDKPLMVVCKTVKGKGVSFMEDNPIWHYRSPNQIEYLQALAEL